MAQNKKNIFKQEHQDIAEFARILSHPARLQILKTLAQQNTCICNEIVEIIPLAQSTVSQHLKELKQAGLIIGEIEGPRTCYCINWEHLNELFEKQNNFIQEIMALRDGLISL